MCHIDLVLNGPNQFNNSKVCYSVFKTENERFKPIVLFCGIRRQQIKNPSTCGCVKCQWWMYEIQCGWSWLIWIRQLLCIKTPCNVTRRFEKLKSTHNSLEDINFFVSHKTNDKNYDFDMPHYLYDNYVEKYFPNHRTKNCWCNAIQ